MSRYSADWTALTSEPDEDTLTWTEAMNRPGPLEHHPLTELGRSFMRSYGIHRDRSWMVDAACQGIPTAVFFPDRPEDVQTAVEVCRGCPVREECSDYADGLEDGRKVAPKEREGVWAGRMRSRSTKPKAPRVAVCQECGVEFVPPKRGPVPIVCSVACTKARHKRRQRERRAS